MSSRESFKVHVTKDYLKFSAAHFIAYRGFRETLHGHNYRLSVEVRGMLGPNGYVVDFGVIKQVAREACKRLDQKVLVPMESDCLEINEREGNIFIESHSGQFSIPRSDCVLLPIVHSSVEELARYLAGQLRAGLRATGIDRLSTIEVGVEETQGQAAYYRSEG